MPEQKHLAGVIGWPVVHSISPHMHNAAFESLGLNWKYTAIPVQPDQLGETLTSLNQSGYRGINVTIPHKQAVIPYLSKLDPSASQIGAVNTIVIQNVDGGYMPYKTTGYNTDAFGFLTSLNEVGFFNNQQSLRAVIVGCGGSSRAVVYALSSHGFQEIIMIARNPTRCHELIQELKAANITVLPFSEENIIEASRHTDLFVNTTPVGMWPDINKSIWPASTSLPKNILVFDLVYNPPHTMLIQQAIQSGVHAIGGLEMLVHQGARAFELWTGIPAPIDIMREACLRELR